MIRCPSERSRTSCLVLVAAGLLCGSAFAAMISTERAMNPYARKKEIPAFTLADLAPPFLEYAYFEGHDLRPFQPDASSFNLANAWWLAEASTLAYADEAFAAEWFRRAGFDEVRFFDKRSTQCFVASNREFAVVAFRGSEVWRRRGANDGHDLTADLMTNADFWLANWTRGAKVHRGFKNALDEVWEDLFPYLAALQRRGCKIWMTGHSLGRPWRRWPQTGTVRSKASTRSAPPGWATAGSRKTIRFGHTGSSTATTWWRECRRPGFMCMWASPDLLIMKEVFETDRPKALLLYPPAVGNAVRGFPLKKIICRKPPFSCRMPS